MTGQIGSRGPMVWSTALCMLYCVATLYFLFVELKAISNFRIGHCRGVDQLQSSWQVAGGRGDSDLPRGEGGGGGGGCRHLNSLRSNSLDVSGNFTF